jgi:hypothetical protein
MLKQMGHEKYFEHLLRKVAASEFWYTWKQLLQ